MPDMDWTQRTAKIADSGTVRPHSPKPCTCEDAQAEVTVRKGDKINLRYCEHCGGGIVSVTKPRRRMRWSAIRVFFRSYRHG